MKGFVYFIYEESIDPTKFKIGITKNNPSKRVIQLNTGNHRQLHIYKTILSENYEQIEKDLHYQLKNSKIRGEWFNISR